MKKDSEIALFDKIYREHFFYERGFKCTSGQVSMMVKDVFAPDMHQFARFKKYLVEERGVVEVRDDNRIIYNNICPKITRESLKISKEALTKNGRFFLTGAPSRAKAHAGFIKAIHNWVGRNDAQFVLLPSCAHVRALEGQTSHYDPSILELSDYFATSFTINDNLIALDLRILPQQVLPLTGLKTYMHGKHSLIIASPKQHLEIIPTGCRKLPRAILSTGVCTRPDYQNNRIGELATDQHVIGGIIVEVDGDFFHARHVQAYPDGSFIDISLSNENEPGCVQYMPNGSIRRVRPEGMILGDIHSDLIDPDAWGASSDIIKRTRPKKVCPHDIYDGNVINPHHEKDAFQRANRRFVGLEEELDATKEIFDCIVDVCQENDAEVVVIKSNHDEMLARHLQSGKWITEHTNVHICAQLFVNQLETGNALASYIDPEGRATWIDSNDDYTIGGRLVSNHGHIGLKGSRGSLKQLGGIKPAVFGHSHTPGISGHSIQVGCLCELKQEYNKGYNDNMHSVCLLYPDMHFSHILIIDGKWCAE